MNKNNISELNQIRNKYNILARTLVDHEHATIKQLYLEAGQTIPEHQVPLDVTFIILNGSGTIRIGEEQEEIKAYDVILCPKNTKMSVQAAKNSELSFLNIKTPGIQSLKKK